MRTAAIVLSAAVFAVVAAAALDLRTAPTIPVFVAGAVYGLFARWILQRRK